MGKLVGQIEHDFKKPEYRYMRPTLDYLCRILSCSIYIEDCDGRLLFTGSDPVGDDWRTDFTPLSFPTIGQYERAIRVWNRSADTYIPVPGDQSFRFRRTILPLTYHSEAFSFVHIVSPASSQPWSVEDREFGELVTAVANKLFILVLGTINEYRVEATGQQETFQIRRAIADSSHEIPTGEDYAMACGFVSLCSGIKTTARTIDYQSVATMVNREFAEIVVEGVGPVTAVSGRTESDNERLDLILYFMAAGPTRLVDVASQLRKALLALDWNLRVGLSMVPIGQEGIERGEREARAMLNLSADNSRTPQILTREGGGVSALSLIKDGGNGFVGYAEFIRTILGDAEQELFSTARSYAFHECNVSETAVDLEVDRRTVTYRLHRIARLTGLDLPSFPAKVVLYLTFLPETPDA